MSERAAREASKLTFSINEQCSALILDAITLAGLDATKDGGKLLFESSAKKGSPYTAQYINRLLKKVAIKLGLKYPLSTHSFRKMFALLIIKGGASVHQARDALGQSSLSATDHYLRTFMSENKSFTDKISF